jgi:hypothetical protein
MSATPARGVRLAAGERGEPVSVVEFHARIIEHCGYALSMHARHRATLPLSAVREAESQIRRQRDAVLSLDDESTALIASWWEQSVESADPWKAWAALFLIASPARPSPTNQILHALEQIPDDDEERWAHAAEALALVPIPDRVHLGRDLLASSCAAARAVGLDVLSRLGALSTETLKTLLDASEPAVAAAAARSVVRAGVAKAVVSELVDCAHFQVAAAAWEAARALTLAGVREPYVEIQRGGPLAAVLGARAVELLVMAGEETDIDTFEVLIAAGPMTPGLLSAVARFGNVTAWSFLAHHLADADLVGPAVSALRTLFGDLVPEAEETSFSAWRRAIGEQDFNPTLRYRAGKPWRPSLVLKECMSGALSRVEVERRVDELAARTGASASVDLGLWEPDARGALVAFARQIESHDARLRAGAWR